jgi:aminopeptidase N
MPPIEPGVSQELAQWRAAHYSDVRYKLNLTLEKMSPVLKGTMEIRVNVSPLPRALTTPAGLTLGGTRAPLPDVPKGFEMPPIVLDWRKIKGSENLSTISNVTLNSRAVSPGFSRPTDQKPPEGGTHNAYLESNEHLIFRDGVVPGENVIKLDFTSPILTSGSAITRYIDKEDGSEYIYSLFVPSDASTAFPVFDQPDLKARFELAVKRPKDWEVISNALGEDSEAVFSDGRPREFTSELVETRPISTYVFAFAAGPFERIWESNDKPRNIKPELKEVYKKWLENDVSWRIDGEHAAEQMRKEKVERLSRGYPSDSRDFPHIYVRKSQAAKFKPHAAEVFRLNREGIKFLETYFDYKFPFPKYDIVLIPEFPFGGMEHAGATFLRESAVIFPQEPTKSDHISRANLIFHETAHQWFGDTVTMKWFDDLWLKEGFAEFMAYKTLEKVMPEANAWKVFYERNKQAAYLTDSTKGTTPIYQPIANLNSAKSAYGNIVYRKAPSFLKQAEFYLGPDKFQTAVRAFLKKHEFANAGWEDLVKELELAAEKDLAEWAQAWVKQPGLPIARIEKSEIDFRDRHPHIPFPKFAQSFKSAYAGSVNRGSDWTTKGQFLIEEKDGKRRTGTYSLGGAFQIYGEKDIAINYLFPNYQDYGYGIFLLDDKSRDYVLKNIHSEKDAFLRSMMWGSLWDSVREAELDPRVYVELVIRNVGSSVVSPGFSRPSNAMPPKGGTHSAPETDETIIQSLLGRVSTAMNYYMTDAQRAAMTPPLEAVLLDRLQNAQTAGERLTFYRAFVNMASTEKGRTVLKQMLKAEPPSSAGGTTAGKNSMSGQTTATPPANAGGSAPVPLRTKDKFDIVTRLAILGDPEAGKLLAELEKTETSDDAKRYAYAARAGFATAENTAKYWDDFVNNKTISESWIEAAFGPFNNIRHSDLTLGYLQKSLQELPNHKRNRKIFFVNGWLAAFIGGQRSEEALAIVTKFLADNPNLDKDLRLKVLENVDLIERAVRIRAKYAKN